MNLERALRIEGWMSTPELTYLAETASRHSRIAEVGSWKGRSTAALAANTSGHVTAIDTWEGSYEQGSDFDPLAVYREFLNNVSGLPVTPVKTESSRYVSEHPDERFDLIFIDAMHEYTSVKRDIELWLPLLTDGGVICGHDFHPNWTGVVQAVKELIPNYRIVDTIWTTET